MHVKVLKLIEEYCRSFIWSGTYTVTKKGLVTWDKVCKPRVFGGLNITNIMLWNKDALAKNCWDLAHKIDKL